MDQTMCATVVVGPNNLFREGLIRILGAADFRILDAISTVDTSVLERLAGHESLLFILDARDESNLALKQIELIKTTKPSWRVVVLDNASHLSNAASIYRAGASAHFINVATSVAFIKFLELVMLGETILPSAFLPFVLDQKNDCDDVGIDPEEKEVACKDDLTLASSATVDDAPMRQLSEREKIILRCIIEGCSNKAIARKIAISEATVKVHVKSILRKVRVHSRTQAAIWGMSCGPSIWKGGDGRMSPRLALELAVSQNPMPALPQPMRSESPLFTAAALRKSEPW